VSELDIKTGRNAPFPLAGEGRPMRPDLSPLPPLWGKVGMGGLDKIRPRELRKILTEAERSL